MQNLIYVILLKEIQNKHFSKNYNFNQIMKCEWTADSTNTGLIFKQLVKTIVDTMKNNVTITEKLINEQCGNKLWWHNTIDCQMKQMYTFYTQESNDWKGYR